MNIDNNKKEKNKTIIVLYIILSAKLLYDICVFVDDPSLQQFIEKTVLTALLFLIILIRNK